MKMRTLLWLLLCSLLMALPASPARATDAVVCPDAPVPIVDPGADVCSVESGGSELLVSGDVLTPGSVYEGGAVVLDAAGTITCVGCGCVAGAAGATRVLCPDAVVSPGLINAHDHVGWVHTEPWVASDNGVDPDLRFEHRHDWRTGARGHPSISAGPGNPTDDERIFGELRFALGGATGFFGSGDAGGLLRDLDDNGSGEGAPGLEGAEYDTFPLGDSNGTLLAAGCAYPNPVTMPSPDADAYVPHVAEGIDEEARNEFRCLTGDGADAVDVLDDSSALIHGIALRGEEGETMAERGIGLVWSPRSNLSLYGDTARVTMMDTLGVSIALGTDWIPTGSMNLLRELACAAEFNEIHLGGYFSDEALWRMVTLGAAEALGAAGAIGQLDVGWAGDLAVFEKAGRSAYQAVVEAGVGEVALVLRGGRVLTGNTNVVAALESGCDEIGELCGSTKRACLLATVGTDWAALLSSIGTPTYPLFSCGAPEDEPSCVPTRTLALDMIGGSTLYDGMSIAGDVDGDGIDEPADNCPDIFNPIRPVDFGAQADADSDGIGDACDSEPVPEPRAPLLLALGLLLLFAPRALRSGYGVSRQ